MCMRFFLIEFGLCGLLLIANMIEVAFYMILILVGYLRV